EDGRRQQEDAVLSHPARRPGAVVLLLEDQPLPERSAAAAVLFRPADDAVASVVERLLPGEVPREAFSRVSRAERLLRDVGCEPRSHFLAERFFSRGEGEIHQLSAATFVWLGWG